MNAEKVTDIPPTDDVSHLVEPVFQILWQRSLFHHPRSNFPCRNIPLEVTVRGLRGQCCKAGFTNTLVPTPGGHPRLHDWTGRYRGDMPSCFWFVRLTFCYLTHS